MTHNNFEDGPEGMESSISIFGWVQKNLLFLGVISVKLLKRVPRSRQVHPLYVVGYYVHTQMHKGGQLGCVPLELRRGHKNVRIVAYSPYTFRFGPLQLQLQLL